MANNRLYLEDAETGERFLVAKGWGRWEWNAEATDITEWLMKRDRQAAEGPDGAPSNLRLVTD